MGLARGYQGVIVALMITLLSACSGGSGAVSTHFALQASSSGIKTITFSWPSYTGATYYHLLVNPDGASGYMQIGGDITATQQAVTVPVHLTDWLNARYMVEAYDGSGLLVSSNTISITSLMLDSIGYLKASNTQAGDFFGARVALSGDGTTLAVAATGEDSNATGINQSGSELATDSGAVYLFVRSSGVWQQQAYIKASNTEAYDAFGSSLALSSDGNTLAVGAIGEDSDATGINGNQLSFLASNSGAVYLFTRSGTTWSQQAYIKASNTGTNDLFGSSVALSSDGNSLAVGATGEGSSATGINGSQTDNNATGSGAVYLFTRNSTTWSQQAYIKASNTEASDAFGGSVALSSDGNTLAVGATGEDSNATGIGGNQADNSAGDAGAVYLLVRSGTAWTQQAYIKASNTDIADLFGKSVALSGDSNTLVVGAIGEDSVATGIDGDQTDNNALSAGAAYLFTRSGITWSQQAYIKASNTGSADNFGTALALSNDGNILVVSALNEASAALGVGGNATDNSAGGAGAIYTYQRVAGIWSWQEYVKAPNTNSGDQFGVSLGLSSDGTTLGVGASGEGSIATGVGGDQTNNDYLNAGAAYLY